MEKVMNETQQPIDPKIYLLQKEFLSLQEACIYLCISQSHMYKLTSGRAIPHYSPTGKLLYFKRVELDAWVLKNKRCSGDELDEKANKYVFEKRRSY